MAVEGEELGASRQRPARIVLVAFPDAQILDVTGPLEVFSTASRELRERRGAQPRSADAYQPELAASKSGRLRTSSGIELVAQRSLSEISGAIDTLIVAGGEGTQRALRDGQLLAWLRRSAPRARRLASVCTGAFLLAEVGLLDGRRATTHWQSCDLLARHYPAVEVDPDPIFVRDGRVYTSAGVCAGMDLALALVEEDHGRELALAVARRLVLFLKRPGGQSQFSAQLSGQLAGRPPLRELQAWIVDHPGAELSVERLAERVGMSPRNFARVFTRDVGTTPARWVERVRIEAARRRLEETDATLEQVACECGFGTADTLRRAFLRSLKVSPSDYRGRFTAAAALSGARGAAARPLRISP